MPARGHPVPVPPAEPTFGRASRVAEQAVYALSIALAVVEVGRVGLTADGGPLAVAIVAAALFVPVHVRHLGYGLRGERPPNAVATLVFIAAVNLVALAVIGQAWSFMFAVLATSALIVVRPPWSFVILAACTGAPWLGAALQPDAGRSFYSDAPYLSYAIVLRAGVQFAIVWLAAAARQLAASRSALAAEATVSERLRLQDEVRRSLHGRLSALTGAVQVVRAALPEPGVAAPVVGLDRLLKLSNEALGDVRALAVGARRPISLPAAAGLARSVRAQQTPLGRGLVTRRAWWIFASVHVLCLGFVLLAGLGILIPTAATGRLFAAVDWACLVALFLPASLAVARGRPVPRPLTRLTLAIVVLGVGQIPTGPGFEFAFFLVGAVAVVCLPRHRALPGLAVCVLAYVAYDTIRYTVPYPGVTPYFFVWNAFSGAVGMLLGVAGLSASARLVAIVCSLAQARDQLADQVTHTERRRMSRDLHDVLGQALTAISLKSDLARRLVSVDRAAAAREVDGLEPVVRTLLAEVEAVTRGEREVAFATETEAAVELLRAAGVEVSVDVRVERLEAEASSVLGWVVREGTTNILRHADARTCSIQAVHGDGVLRLEVVNDGADRSRDQAGTGLLSLADRASAVSGRLESAPVGDGRFRLSVEVPA